MHQHAKFRWNWSSGCWDTAIFLFPRWRSFAILDFQKCEILTADRVQGVNMHLHAKFHRNRSNGCWDIAIFRFSRWRPSAILDFQKCVVLTVSWLQGVNTHHLAKFCQNRSFIMVAEIWRFFNFLRWRPPVILDLLCAYLDHPRRVLGGLYRCAKLGWNRLWRYANFNFMQVWLENAYSRPSFGCFWGKNGGNGNFVYLYPSRNATHPETRILRLTCHNRSSALTPSCAKETTKNKIKSKTLNISPICGGHAPYPTDIPFGVSSGIPNNHPCQISCWSVKGFLGGRTPQKCHFLCLLERPLQQSCTTVQTVIGVGTYHLVAAGG